MKTPVDGYLHYGLRKNVMDYLDVELKAISHTKLKDDAVKPFSMDATRAGVRTVDAGEK